MCVFLQNLLARAIFDVKQTSVSSEKRLPFIYQQITLKVRKYYVFAKVQNKPRQNKRPLFQVFNKGFLIMSNLTHF